MERERAHAARADAGEPWHHEPVPPVRAGWPVASSRHARWHREHMAVVRRRFWGTSAADWKGLCRGTERERFAGCLPGWNERSLDDPHADPSPAVQARSFRQERVALVRGAVRCIWNVD